MSFVALATEKFETVCRFYGETLALTELAAWDRDNGRGKRFDLHGLTLEIIDNRREAAPQALAATGRGLHLVAEVPDVAAIHARLRLDCPAPQTTSWNASCFALQDPDGVTVTFLQWRKP